MIVGCLTTFNQLTIINQRSSYVNYCVEMIVNCLTPFNQLTKTNQRSNYVHILVDHKVYRDIKTLDIYNQFLRLLSRYHVSGRTDRKKGMGGWSDGRGQLKRCKIIIIKRVHIHMYVHVKG